MCPRCSNGWGNSFMFAQSSIQSWNIIFEPALPGWMLIALALAGAGVIVYSAWRRARGAPWRTLAVGLTLLALLNPTMQQEDREPVSDVAAVIVDRSASQQIGDRPQQTEEALKQIEAKLGQIKGLETRIVNAGSAAEDGTNLFTTLDRALADVPRERLAGVIFLTDGQVHDLPANIKSLGLNAPVHALITGRKDEKDRRLTIVQAPRFGIVGEALRLTFRIDDADQGKTQPGQTPSPQLPPAQVKVRIAVNGEDVMSPEVPTGEDIEVPLTLSHAGANFIEISAAPAENELTLLNNRAVVSATGIRDRLRVLLVSGEPHPGERTWRNLLKADPSVDLVHFTILRPPEKQDDTPLDELSLIAFPTHALFVEKLSEFDLIVFDRFKRQDVLPLEYLQNIADYVRNGGAVLDAAGPSFATSASLFNTPLGGILPAEPTGEVTIGGYVPQMTDKGRRHPVTAGLPGAEQNPPAWGRWLRVINTNLSQTANKNGEVLMETPDRQPLVVLSHAGDGRVAQVLSDQIWLWSRGFEGGGPQSELLRRLAHWLMKEPDLEEESLRASIDGQTLHIERRSMADTVTDAEITFPSGKTQQIKLERGDAGLFEARLSISETGLYRIRNDAHSAVAAVGALNPREFADVRATDAVLKPLAEATGGGIYWLGDKGRDVPSMRSVGNSHDTAGTDWIGLKRNEQYLVRAVRQVPLLSGVVALFAILGALAMAWRREGR